MSTGSDDIFSAIDTYLGEGSAMVSGVIRSISGTVALVQIEGSSRQQQAYYSKSMNLKPGDQCLMARTRRNARWIVFSAWGTPTAGHSDETPPENSEESDLTLANYTFEGAFSAINIGTKISYFECFSIQLSTVKPNGVIMAMFTGSLYFTSYSEKATVRIKLDGQQVGGSVDVAGNTGTDFTNYPISFYFIQPAEDGSHTISIDAKLGNSLGTSSYCQFSCSNFSAVEL